jgi:hypothetical protein
MYLLDDSKELEYFLGYANDVTKRFERIAFDPDPSNFELIVINIC